MKIFFTAFEPFGGRISNVSAQLLEQLPGPKALLPVSFRRAPVLALEAVERERPDLVICLGEAASRTEICLERVALNLMHAQKPDNDGYRPQHQRIIPDAPDGIFTPIDVDTLAAATGSIVSNSAGLYVCNALYYTLLHHRIPTLFIHLPAANTTENTQTIAQLRTALHGGWR